MPTKTLTFGIVPSNLWFRDAFAAQGIATFPVEMHEHSKEFAALQSAINVGIDSHLEAVRFEKFAGSYGRRGFRFGPPALRTLVRRLVDSGSDEAESLASGIVASLGLEWV